MKKYTQIIFSFLILLLIAEKNLFASTVERPPQYVLLAFDGSLNNEMWDETISFAKNNNAKFSYFISGVYFLLNENRANYSEPTKGLGVSNIGFAGDSKTKLVDRVNYLNRAYDDGHTIGSHANGHFDGSEWSTSQWESEFQQFYNLIFNVYNQKGIEIQNYINPFHFNPEQIVGFRSPLLATNKNLYSTLKKNNFSYDTSQTNDMDYWPHLDKGIWNFPLAELRIYGTGIQTLSMDYNFYVADSRGNPDPDNSELYRERMYKTYMAYFNSNYYGNRAPIHIGHHFSKWNKGAYWQAFMDFTKSVCMKPEVKCVGYQSLLEFMNSIDLSTRKEYQIGNFPKLSIPEIIKKDIAAIAPIEVSFLMKKINKEQIELKLVGKDAKLFPKNSTYRWYIDDKEMFQSKKTRINFSSFAKMKKSFKLSAVLENGKNKLIKTTHNISYNDYNDFTIQEEDLEKRALQGDLPEAHKD